MTEFRREEDDFSQSTRNPYAKKLRKAVTIRLGVDIIEYFKGISEETGIPYQTLINLYLRACLKNQFRVPYRCKYRLDAWS